MRIYEINPNDTKRVQLLKKVAQHQHQRLMENAGQAYNPSLDKKLSASILRLNARIRRSLEETGDSDQLTMFDNYNDKTGIIKGIKIWFSQMFK